MHKKVLKMSEKTNYIAAIDIGTTKIVAVVGRVHRKQDGTVDKLEILSKGEVPAMGMHRGTINNMKDVINCIKKATTKAGFKEEFGINQVYVGVSGYTIRSQQVEHYRLLPKGIVTERDVEILTAEVYNTAVKETEEILHVIPFTFRVDEEKRENPVGFSGKRLEGQFYLIVGDTKFINGLRLAIKQAGFDVKKIIFEPLASAEAVLTKDEKQGGVALVDIGGGTTDIVVFHRHNLIFSKVIPFGGNSITEDIRNALEILDSQAEDIKIQYGSAISLHKQDETLIKIEGIAGRPPRLVTKRSLSLIIQTRITEIIDTLYEFIKPFKENRQLAAGITITGGGALLEDLQPLVNYRTELDVRIGIPKLADIEELNKPQYATTLGLLIKGDEYEQQMADDEITVDPQDPQKKEENASFLNPIKKLFNAISNLSKPDDEL